MHTSHQFLLLSSPPAKEARFRTAKKLYGSTFAFHMDLAHYTPVVAHCLYSHSTLFYLFFLILPLSTLALVVPI
ncbi:hypothetical protein F7725_026012 [Dissostichus mawsoni]|uniref:Uncharacterized protein n=1 Tax=Dissostichus mawsoni TaxID=36200 RepID=A0A7J5X6T0_DISMA|nr:hypothetical protein F7725_026012 [Dissostichus mawsoni]